MMKPTKLIALFLAIGMTAAAFTACGSDKANDPEDTTAVTDAATNADTDADTDAATDAATDADTDADTDAVTDEVTDAATEPETEADPNEAKYEEAKALLAQGDYEGAYALFLELGDYKDARAEASKFHYMPTRYTFVTTYLDNTMEKTTVNITYDENNLPVKCVYDVEDGEDYTCDITYDAQGRMTKFVTAYNDGSYASYERIYNEKGLLIKEIDIYSDGVDVSQGTAEYTYDEEGRCLTAVCENMELYGYYDAYEYTYDAEGRLILSVFKYGEETFTCELFYDEAGRVIREVQKDAEGNVLSVNENEYDARGNRIKVDSKEGDTIVYRDEFTYDENGWMIRENTYYDGDMSFLVEYTHDDHGCIIKIRDVFVDYFETVKEYEWKLSYVPFEYGEEEWTIIEEYAFSMNLD